MNILENIDLAPHTTFKIGGKARYFCIAKSEEEVLGALAFARARSMPFFILGGGSNLLVSDAGFAGLVIQMAMAGASYEKKGDDIFVTAWAGESWDELVAKTVEWGAWGIENLSAIPGTVGAAPVQNIGAYGAEVKDVIESVRAIDAETGAAKVFSNAECRFSYRDSFFKTPEGKKYAITSVTFRLSASPKPNLEYKDLANIGKTSQSDIREAVIAIRAGKFPDLSQIGTAGSFWKNPVISAEEFEKLKAAYPDMPSFPAGDRVKVPLAWILDRVCGLKGYSKGAVGLFKNQPLVVVAEKGASSADIHALQKRVADMVKEKTGIAIEPEVGYLS